jgi:DNA-directed RNA polymerase alpha subunit
MIILDKNISLEDAHENISNILSEELTKLEKLQDKFIICEDTHGIDSPHCEKFNAEIEKKERYVRFITNLAKLIDNEIY